MRSFVSLSVVVVLDTCTIVLSEGRKCHESIWVCWCCAMRKIISIPTYSCGLACFHNIDVRESEGGVQYTCAVMIRMPSSCLQSRNGIYVLSEWSISGICHWEGSSVLSICEIGQCMYSQERVCLCSRFDSSVPVKTGPLGHKNGTAKPLFWVLHIIVSTANAYLHIKGGISISIIQFTIFTWRTANIFLQ